MTAATIVSPLTISRRGSEAWVQDPAGDLGAGHDAERLGKCRKTALQRAETEPVLEEKCDEVQQPEEAGGGDEQAGRGRSEQPIAEQAQVEQRFGSTELGEDQQPDQDRADHDRGQDRNVVPALLRSFADAVHQTGEADAGQDETEQVEAPGGRHLDLVQEHEAEGERECPDRQVDEKDPSPRQGVDEHAAEHWTDRGCQRCRHNQDAGGAHAFGRWEQRGTTWPCRRA